MAGTPATRLYLGRHRLRAVAVLQPFRPRKAAGVAALQPGLYNVGSPLAESLRHHQPSHCLGKEASLRHGVPERPEVEGDIPRPKPMRILIIHNEAPYFAGAEKVLGYYLEGWPARGEGVTTTLVSDARLLDLIPLSVRRIGIPEKQQFSILKLCRQATPL